MKKILGEILSEFLSALPGIIIFSIFYTTSIVLDEKSHVEALARSAALMAIIAYAKARKNEP